MSYTFNYYPFEVIPGNIEQSSRFYDDLRFCNLLNVPLPNDLNGNEKSPEINART